MSDIPDIKASNYLPQECQTPLYQALLGALDSQAAVLQHLLTPESFTEVYLNPETSQHLDYRASMSLIRTVWSADWPEIAKREILKNQIWLITHRYSPLDTFPQLFEWFDLDARIEPPGGFVLGAPTADHPNAGKLGNTSETLGLGLNIPASVLEMEPKDRPTFDVTRYKIVVPPSYRPGTYELKTVKEIIGLLGLPYRIPITDTDGNVIEQ